MSADEPSPLEPVMEAAAAAYRERDAWGRILPAPPWFDLAPAERERLFDLQAESRAWERLIHPQGLSATAQEVTRRARRLGQIGGPGSPATSTPPPRQT